MHNNTLSSRETTPGRLPAQRGSHRTRTPTNSDLRCSRSLEIYSPREGPVMHPLLHLWDYFEVFGWIASRSRCREDRGGDM